MTSRRHGAIIDNAPGRSFPGSCRAEGEPGTGATFFFTLG